MKLIDGKELARSLRGEIAAGVAALKSEKGVTPGLAVILVGDNPASVSYVTAKEKACTEAGMLSREIRLPAETTEEELVSLVKKLNCDPEIHGILVQDCAREGRRRLHAYQRRQDDDRRRMLSSLHAARHNQAD